MNVPYVIQKDIVYPVKLVIIYKEQNVYYVKTKIVIPVKIIPHVKYAPKENKDP